MDVLLLDECGQLSAQQFALIDIILRHVRDSSLPFGGVLIFGTFDHHQLGAIVGLPFVLSTHILTDFTLVQLKHSVRAAGDPILRVSSDVILCDNLESMIPSMEQYNVIIITNIADWATRYVVQEIQAIARTSPFVLRANKVLKDRFIYLITTYFRFVNSFSDPLITSEHLRLYHRRKAVSEAHNTFVNDTKKCLIRENVNFTECASRDMKKTSNSRTDLQETHNEQVVKLLNNKVREPHHLLFYPTALFMSTVNTDTYSQSQTLMMLDVPSTSDVENRKPLTLYAAPVQDSPLEHNLNFRSPPSKEDLLKQKWEEVKVDVCMERLVTRDHISACRRQYTLVHVGASTVSIAL